MYVIRPMCAREGEPSVRSMKTLLALAAVSAALILAGPAGAMLIQDAYPDSAPDAVPAPPAPHNDHTVVWAALTGAVAFGLGAASVRLVRIPRRAPA
jgi:hypothetical protein